MAAKFQGSGRLYVAVESWNRTADVATPSHVLHNYELLIPNKS